MTDRPCARTTDTALMRFFRDVLAPQGETATGAYVCRCGLLAAWCAVHRAAVRHGLAEAVPWTPLPEDIAVRDGNARRPPLTAPATYPARHRAPAR